jgi:hypothetical protein
MNRQRLRHFLTAGVYVLTLGGFLVANVIIPHPTVSLSERRELAPFPALSVSGLLNGSFAKGFDSYATDAFTLRERFKALHAIVVFSVFNQTDDNGLYVDDSGVGRFERLNEVEYRLSALKISKVANTLPGMRFYVCIVPDKSLFAHESYPGYDPQAARGILTRELEAFRYIDLTGVLDATKYYTGDLHWDQTRILDVTEALLKEMDALGDFHEIVTSVAGQFKGVYASQLPLSSESDLMTYATGGYLDEALAWFLNSRTMEYDPGAVYDLEAFNGRDPYDLFLSGAQGVVILENPLQTNGRELYLFRDSFGSSIAPLLLSGYQKVTLIDLRYIDSRLLESQVDFSENGDFLFLYGSGVLNNSSVLRVPMP